MNEPTGGVSITLQSVQGGRQTNEDRFLCADVNGGKLLAVFDGHYGADCSEYCQNNFGRIFADWLEIYEPCEALQTAIYHIMKDLSKRDSGTTLSAAYVYPEADRVAIGFVGDSPVAVLANGRFTMPKPHSAQYNLEERKRAISRGAEYDKARRKLTFRAAEGEHSFGVTRALGNKALDQILIRVPEPLDLELPTAAEAVIMLASDGIMIRPDYGAESDRIERALRNGMSAHQLVEVADHENVGDNITAIVWHRSPVTAEHSIPG